MSAFSRLSGPSLPTVTIEVRPPNTIALQGTMTMRDPAPEIGRFFKAAHAAAVEDRLQEVRLDVRKLAFVNSSSIRLFVDWTTMVRAEGDQTRYRLRFVIDRHVAWQKTAFSALLTLARQVVEVEAAE